MRAFLKCTLFALFKMDLLFLSKFPNDYSSLLRKFALDWHNRNATRNKVKKCVKVIYPHLIHS